MGFLFSFFVEAGFVELQSNSAWNQGTILMRRFEEPASPWLTQGLQLDLEIALNGVSAKIQPRRVFTSAENKLKRRMT